MTGDQIFDLRIPSLIIVALMDFDAVFALAGYLIFPIFIVLAFAIFIHCILSLHRQQQQRATQEDSLVNTPQRSFLWSSNDRPTLPV